MNEMVFQPLFHDSDKPVGYFVSIDFFGVSGSIIEFGKCPRISAPFWREHIFDEVFTAIFEHIVDVGDSDKMMLSESDKQVYDLKEEFDVFFKENIDVADLYIYSHTPTKSGGYVRILTEPDTCETGKLYIDESKFYPEDVKKAGPVEKFLYANTDEWEQYFRLPDSMKKDCGKYYWKFGDNLMFNPDIISLYFNDVVAWNELYWDLFHAIGRQWGRCDFVEAWRECGCDNEKSLMAETDAQRLLFWCMENDYTLDDLKQMVSEKRILTKRILGTQQDSWMTLQYGL